MCTALLRFDPAAAWPLLVAFIRDEDRARPTDPPGSWWPEHPEIVGGRDQRRGGTWLAAAHRPAAPAVAFVLNRYDPERLFAARPDSISRGTLPIHTLVHDGFDPGDVDLERIEPFHLVHATPDRAGWWYWNGTAIEHEELTPGLHMIASRGLEIDREAARRATQLARFGAAPDPLFDEEAPTCEAWGAWTHLLDGRDAQIDDPEALVIAGVSAYPRFGTVGASLVAIARDRRLRYDVSTSHSLDPDSWQRVVEPVRSTR